MQIASNEFKASMKNQLRNRGYVKVNIGVFNNNAQEDVTASGNFEWWSDKEKLFDNYKVTKQYATKDKDFSILDGSMYFAPDPNYSEIYNNGIVTVDNIVTLSFTQAFDIKGFTINFGHCYPTNLTITTNNTTHTYNNDSANFTTEDIYNGTTQITIKANNMVNGGRMRILEFFCGIVNYFDNTEVINTNWKEYVSSIAESIPSQDLSITVDNQNMYYSPNNPESTLAYMELGQPITMSFGYDVDGNGKIEWIKPVTAYLKTWQADEKQAKFTATDIFDYQLNETYDKDIYHTSGISLYDLAVNVFTDAGIDDRNYKIDKYLQGIIVYNPLPRCTHAEALQIIANAGRCALLITRDNQICLSSSFVPTTTVTTNDMASYGKLENIMSSSAKQDYAIRSQGFNKVNNTLYFYDSKEDLASGYVSESYYAGGKWIGTTPKLILDFESVWTFYGLGIAFKNVYPQQIKITAYNDDVVVSSKTYSVNALNWATEDEFDEVNKVVIDFIKGSENSKLFVDSILVSDITAYTISRTTDIVGATTAERNNKTKSISVVKNSYRTTSEQKELASGSVEMKSYSNTEVTVEFSNPSYGYTVDIDGGFGNIIKSSAHYCTIKLGNGSSYDHSVDYKIKGYEYAIDNSSYKKNHNNSGEEITWNNPLISNDELASKLEEWLSDYYLGQVSYSIPWRGDPRIDANDLFYVETSNRGKDLIRVYQNELSFNGAWKGTLKGRVADLSWQ